MPLQAVDSRRLYRQIADQIAALIEKGEYRAGGRLPPERDLAKQLGVSRPSVREALIALEVEGYVEVRVGSGVYVIGPAPAARPAALPADSGPFELIRARWLIEAECAALAAKHAGKAQVRAMEEALLFLRLEHHFDTPELWGVAIEEHREIVAAIAKHDGSAARAAMRRHMDHAARRFSKSWEKKKRK